MVVQVTHFFGFFRKYTTIWGYCKNILPFGGNFKMLAWTLYNTDWTPCQALMGVPPGFEVEDCISVLQIL